jgi:hypothetical protein
MKLGRGQHLKLLSITRMMFACCAHQQHLAPHLCCSPRCGVCSLCWFGSFTNGVVETGLSKLDLICLLGGCTLQVPTVVWVWFAASAGDTIQVLTVV